MNEKAKWEESHCTKCHGAYKVADLGYGGEKVYDYAVHRCRDFCSACKKKPEWCKELDLYDHVCGIDEHTLWLDYQAKISGYSTHEEYLAAKIGSERTWSIPHIAWAVASFLVASICAMAFLATGSVFLLAIAGLNGAMLLPSVKGITTIETFRAKVLEITEK